MTAFFRPLFACVALSLAAAPAHAATHEVDIKGMAFVPADLMVAAGDTVIFTNRDATPHTATAADGSFDTGRLGKGQSASVTLGAAGVIAYACKLHPMMKGKITAR